MTQVAPRPPSWAPLALAAFVGLVIASNVASALWARWVEINPEGLLMLSSRNRYLALLSMCDASLGRLLDLMDARDMWKDTALVVTTDHGFLLGEHDWWAKNRMNMYEEVAHIPLFVWLGV